MSKKSRRLAQISPSQVATTVAPEISTGEAIISATQIPVAVLDEKEAAPRELSPIEELAKTIPSEIVATKEDKSTVRMNSTDTSMIKNTVVVPDVVVPEPVSQSVLFIRDYINDYLKYLSSTQHKNVHTSIKKFQRIINYAVKMQNDVPVLEEVYKFFKNERKKILRPDTALQGIHLLPSADREKIQHAYTLFLTVTAPGKTNPINYQFASKVFGTGNFLSFIMDKVKK